jgi:CMP-N-acetylneuraminic acid synthetase
MKSLGILPARKGSQRFPDKHHARLLGRPLFSYTLEAAVEAKRLDRLVISSDDLSLKPLAEQYGVEFIQRPADLATLTSALEETLCHVCRLLRERDGFRPDLVMTMQGNVPVRKEGQIDEVIRRLEEMPQATAVCTAQEIRLRPEWAKVMKDETSGEVAPYLPGFAAFRAQDYPKIFLMDGAVYGVREDTLFAREGKTDAHHWLGERIHFLVQDHAMYSLEVDYPDQVPLAEFYLLYKRLGRRWLQGAGDLDESDLKDAHPFPRQ